MRHQVSQNNHHHQKNKLNWSRAEGDRTTQVEVARPKWPLIRRVSSAHMFPVRSNYMVWKRLRAHFCLDNGLELAWSEATLFWDGLIRGHFGLGRSDQRQFQAHTSLIRGRFERTLVWPETNSSDIFFMFFLFSYWLLLSRLRDINKTAFWSELHLKIWWVWSEPRGPADNNCRSPQEKILNQSRSRRFYAELSKFIFSVKSIKKWHTQ